MNINRDQINDLYEAEVETTDGDNVGGVGQVYVDDQTGNPSWVTVKTGWFGGNESLVPLNEAQFVDGKIRVPYTKDLIKDAPNFDSEHHLSVEDEDAVYRHYGINTGTAAAGQYTETETRTEGQYTDGQVAEGYVAGDAAQRDYAAGDVNRDVNANRDADGQITLHEERVNVGTERVEAGRVRLRKHVVTEQETVTVPVTREEYEIVREPIAEGEVGGQLGEDEVEVVLHEDRPVIQKETVATERIGLQTEQHQENRQVTTDVSREEVDVVDDARQVQGGVADAKGEFRDGVEGTEGLVDDARDDLR